jgi:hypothetical protein
VDNDRQVGMVPVKGIEPSTFALRIKFSRARLLI